MYIIRKMEFMDQMYKGFTYKKFRICKMNSRKQRRRSRGESDENKQEILNDTIRTENDWKMKYDLLVIEDSHKWTDQIAPPFLLMTGRFSSLKLLFSPE